MMSPMLLDLTNLENSEIKYKSFNFTSGEAQFKFEPQWDAISRGIVIYFKYEGDSSLFRLAMAVDSIRRLVKCKLILKMPYFPGSRQDRVMNPMECMSLKVYADFINNLKFDKVYILDPHSDVTPALINDCVIKDNHHYVNSVIHQCLYNFPKYKICLISPDAGANKKIYKLLDAIGPYNVIRADKTRNTSTGKITDTIVYAEDLTEQTCIIVDDIISYGNTFKKLATKLKELNAEKVILITTFNEGVVDMLSLQASGVDEFHTTNGLPFKIFYNMDNMEEPSGFLTTHEVFQYM